MGGWFLWSVLGTVAYVIYQSQQATPPALAWPPSTAVQTALQQQIAALVQDVTGQPVNATQAAQLQAQLANAPALYQAGLPQGATPTVANYQAWVMTGAFEQAAATTNAQGQPVAQSGAQVGAGGAMWADLPRSYGVLINEYGNEVDDYGNTVFRNTAGDVVYYGQWP